MTTLTLFGTAWWATRLLGVCSATWVVAGLTADGAIAWRAIGTLWLLGWPMLFVGFTAHAFLDAAGSDHAEADAPDSQAADAPSLVPPR
jgi:hypothetical protein